MKAKIFFVLLITLSVSLLTIKNPDRLKQEYYLAGVVPHHLLAQSIIVDFFQRFSVQRPKTIILLGPNHFQKGNDKILTTLSDWQTPFGTLQIDQGLVKSIIQAELVQVDAEVLSSEHSIANLVPIIKDILPEAKIVPLVLKNNLILEEIETLADYLANIISEEKIVVASVDFSHNLKRDQANKNDQKTIKLIEEFDYFSLHSLTDDYLDSPSSVILILKIMQKRGRERFKALEHANSADLTNNYFAEVTSYYSLLF